MKNQQSVAAAARPIFASLKNQFEAEHLNRSVAIEPISGEYFVADTLSEAFGSKQGSLEIWYYQNLSSRTWS